MDAPSRPHWFSLTPDRLVIGLLILECLLWLSNWLGWWHKGYAVLATIAVVSVFLLLMLLWFLIAMVFRRRFQFSLRTLLTLATLAGTPGATTVYTREVRLTHPRMAPLTKCPDDA